MAKKEIVTLTKADRDYIQAIGHKVRRSVNNPTNRPPPYVYVDNFSSEVHIAKTGIDGIPAMTTSDEDVGTGTEVGTGTDTETIYYPGVAECAIYTIRDQWSTTLEIDIPELSAIDNYNKQVYNLSSCEIPAETWVLLSLIKGGKWVIAEVYAECDIETGTGTGTGTGSGSGSSSGTEETTGTGSVDTGTGDIVDTGTGSAGIVSGTGTGSDVTGTGGTDTGTGIAETGTGSVGTGDGCLQIPGVDLSTLAIVTDPDYILGIKDGCLVKVPVSSCNGTG